MRTLCIVFIALWAAVPLCSGCGGTSSSPKVITYQGPAENAPKPKGMMRKGYQSRQPGHDAADDTAPSVFEKTSGK